MQQQFKEYDLYCKTRRMQTKNRDSFHSEMFYPLSFHNFRPVKKYTKMFQVEFNCNYKKIGYRANQISSHKPIALL